MASATVARRSGSNSLSNHGLRFSQPVFRHEGCGSGNSRGVALANARQRRTISSTWRSSAALRCAARNGSDAHSRRSPAPPPPAASAGTIRRAMRPRIRDAAECLGANAGVVAREAETHRRDADARRVVERLAVDEPGARRRSPDASSNGRPDLSHPQPRRPGWRSAACRWWIRAEPAADRAGAGRPRVVRGRCGRREAVRRRSRVQISTTSPSSAASTPLSAQICGSALPARRRPCA